MAKANRKSKPRRRSRTTLNQMIDDLAKRLHAAREEAEAFQSIIKPNGEHTMSEHRTRTACGVMLHSLLWRIDDAEGFARLLVRGEVAA